MILTGKKIIQEISCGDIIIKPFNIKQVNPNSYNYRLSKTIKIFEGMKESKPVFKEVNIPQNGFITKPYQLYLAHTLEIIGSKKYAMSLIGRSSMGRLGVFAQASANLGHTTSEHQWTLEIVASQKTKLYPNMIFGQVSFWENKGHVEDYSGQYGRLNGTQEFLIHKNDTHWK